MDIGRIGRQRYLLAGLSHQPWRQARNDGVPATSSDTSVSEPERLDDRRPSTEERRARAAVPDEMLGPHADQHAGPRAAVLASTSAGSRFIGGAPMKPATNSVAGVS